MRPWPRQVGHQPRGELKEKCFGSSSGKDSPLAMSVRVVENQLSTSPDGSTKKHEPRPSLRAWSSKERGAWSKEPDFGFVDVALDFELLAPSSLLPALRSATTTSMSCSL